MKILKTIRETPKAARSDHRGKSEHAIETKMGEASQSIGRVESLGSEQVLASKEKDIKAQARYNRKSEAP